MVVKLGWFTNRLKVTTLSHPRLDTKVWEYTPAFDKLFPPNTYTLGAQMVTLIELDKFGTANKFKVTILSHPTALINVAV